MGDLKVIFKMWCHTSHDFILYLAKVQFIINCLMAVFSKKKTTNNIIHNLLRDIFVTKNFEGVLYCPFMAYKMAMNTETIG